jgi:hypothetical protein
MAKPEGKVTAVLTRMAINAPDGLGWYAAVLAETPHSLPATPRERSALIERVMRLGASGLLPVMAVARTLRRIPDVDTDRLVRLVIRLGDAGQPRREVWSALALCGEPGLDRLERDVWDEPELDGQARALYEVDADRAIAALRFRVFVRGRPVGAADAGALRGFTDQDVEVLAEGLRRNPTNYQLAQILGWTRHDRAREVLLDPALLDHPDEAARVSVLHGLGAYSATRSHRAVDAALVRLARTDPSRTVRMTARTRVEVRGLLSPATQQRLETGGTVDDYTEDPVLGTVTADTFCDLLLTDGPARRLVLAYLERHAELLVPDPDGGNRVADAVAELSTRALRGLCGAETVLSLCAILGEEFVVPALTVLASEAEVNRHGLAAGITRSVPGRRDVYLALARNAGFHPDPLFQMTLRAYDLDPRQRAEILLNLLLTLSTANPASVRVWTDALRELTSAFPERLITGDFMTRMAEATERVLGLLPAAEDPL